MRATRAELRKGCAGAYVPYDVCGLHANFSGQAAPSRGEYGLRFWTPGPETRHLKCKTRHLLWVAPFLRLTGPRVKVIVHRRGFVPSPAPRDPSFARWGDFGRPRRPSRRSRSRHIIRHYLQLLERPNAAAVSGGTPRTCPTHCRGAGMPSGDLCHVAPRGGTPHMISATELVQIAAPACSTGFGTFSGSLGSAKGLAGGLAGPAMGVSKGRTSGRLNFCASRAQLARPPRLWSPGYGLSNAPSRANCARDGAELGGCKAPTAPALR